LLPDQPNIEQQQQKAAAKEAKRQDRQARRDTARKSVLVKRRLKHYLAKADAAADAVKAKKTEEDLRKGMTKYHQLLNIQYSLSGSCVTDDRLSKKCKHPFSVLLYGRDRLSKKCKHPVSVVW
jgi:hypothetical protein